MRKFLSAICLGLLVVIGGSSRSAAAPAGMTALTGHVPAVVKTLTATGRLAATNTLHLAIGLPLRNRELLTNLLQQINDPASQNYHHFLTPSQFTDQFGPTAKDYQAVLDFANSNNLTVARTHGNRMLVEVDAKASDIEHAFAVTLRTYRDPKDNRQFFSPDAEPSVPTGLPVLDVSGLNNYTRPQSFIKLKPSTPNGASASSLTGSAPDGSGNYFGNDFHKAYLPGTTLTGAGQKIALVQFDGYFPNDIAAYAQAAGLPALSITNILLDGFNGFPTLTGGEVEVELDIEMVNAMAPGISQLLVYEENPDIFNPVVILNQIAMDNIAKQIGCSWSLGVAPSGSGTINQILQQMILQGQSFLQASGDSDALLPGQADDPNGFFGICCDPFLTSVGGTKLTTDVGGNYLSESVWNDRVPNIGQGGYEGSGGGISDFYATPSWQQGFGNAGNHGSATGRNFPDVAFTATDIYIIYDNGQAGAVGGTSCAAPLWAGFMALVNQQGTLSGKPPVGFLNPAIYALAKTASYTNFFNDITNGDNTWPGSPTNFFAVSGYDLSTGLGTPNTNLINALINGAVAIPVIPAPKGPYGTTLSVMTNSNPNGPWFLFVQDDSLGDIGNIGSGWLLNLTTADPVESPADVGVSVTSSAGTVAISNNVTFVVAVTNYGPSGAANVVVTNTLPVDYCCQDAFGRSHHQLCRRHHDHHRS